MKIFRDPIHNVIDLDTGDKAVNDLLLALIDSKEFQRLHFIKQLGVAYLVYPSATHSRFEHSLGVAFLAKRFINKIISLEEQILGFYENSKHRSKFVNFFEQIKKTKSITIVAALLHDIGHGPLSHVTEDIIGISHEEWVQEIILGKTQVNELLLNFDKNWPQIICDILLGKQNDSLPSAKLIAGQLDIDKIDYLLRDSYMTGSKYGKFDVEWLLNVLTVGIVGGTNGQVEIGLDLGKGLSVAEQFVMARINMFKNIYLHKTNLIAQKMLRLLLGRIKELPLEDTEEYFSNEHFRKVFFSHDEKASSLLADYLAISDIDFFYLLKSFQGSKDEVLKRLSTGILNRNLFKRAELEHWHNISPFITINKKMGKGMDKYYMVELEIDAKEERLTYRPGIDKVYLFDKNGNGHELLEKSMVLPPTTHNEAIPLGHYVDFDIYSQYLNELKDNKNTESTAISWKRLEINIDQSRLEELMVASIEQAARSINEERDDGKISPKVGAVLCDFNGKVLATAFRGEGGEGHHCEFSLLTKAQKQGIDCSKTVLFVTLEPCTIRNEPKEPCAKRIVDAGIPRVYMGALDPNDRFRGMGEIYLRDHNIVVERYPADFIKVISTMNKDFEKQFETKE